MVNLSIKQRKGFTVIELMIVLVIVAILVALAYPAFSNYARKAKRHAVQEALLNWSVQQEIWRSNNPGYNDINPGVDGSIGPDPADTPDYDLAVTVFEGGLSYSLTATAKGDQADNDKAKDGSRCTPLRLNQNNEKFPPVCWK